MSQPERTRVSAWTRLRAFAVGKYKGVQLSIERRSFEHKLEAIVRAALAHRSNGLPAGDRQYRLLKDQASAICADFAARWNVDPNLLDAQIPAISKLRSLADPPPKASLAVFTTVGGFNGYEVTSALQKCIRRGLEKDALFWATELWASCDATGRQYIWHRLRIIASEDVGLADSNAAVQVRTLYDNFRDRPNEKLFLWHAVLLLARAPKSRIVDHAGIAIAEGDRSSWKIPPFAIDNHAGGRLNWSESFKLEGCALDDPYEPIARKIREKKAALKDLGKVVK